MEVVNSPPYNPQSNMVERFHRTLNSMLRLFVDRGSTAWEQHLPTAVFAYNSKVHSSTGLSPYFALMGREPRIPLDLVMKLPEEGSLPLTDYVKQMRRRFQLMMEFIRDKGEATITRNQHSYEGEKNKWKPGDLVWYFCPRVLAGKPKKLQNHWTGPFEVKKRVAAVLVEIKPAHTEGSSRVVHTSRIRIYHKGDGRLRQGPRDQEFDDEGDEEGAAVNPTSSWAPSMLTVPVHMPPAEAMVREAPAAPMTEELTPPRERGLADEDSPMGDEPPAVQEEEMRDTLEEPVGTPDGDLGPATTPDEMEAGDSGAERGRLARSEAGSGRSDQPGTSGKRKERADSSVETRYPLRKLRQAVMDSVKATRARWRDAGTESGVSGTDSSDEDWIAAVSRDMLERIQAVQESAGLVRRAPAGMAVESPVSYTIPPGAVATLPLQWQLRVPEGCRIQLTSTLGLQKKGVVLVAGKRGELSNGGLEVTFLNNGREPYKIQKGQRVLYLHWKPRVVGAEDGGDLHSPHFCWLE